MVACIEMKNSCLKGVCLNMKASSLVKLLSLIMIALFISIAAGCQFLLPPEEKQMDYPLVEPKDVIYSTVDVQRGDMVKSVQGMGRAESVRFVDLFYKTGGGRIKGINFKIGDIVKKGDVLIELDTDDLDHQLQIARLELKQMENEYASFKKAMRSARDKTPLKNFEISLQIKRLNIKYDEEQKANSVLTAPIDGSVVYITTANQGSWVDAYSTLVRIADQSVKMLVYNDSMNRSSFQIGMKVQVTRRLNNDMVEGEVVSTPFERDKFDTEKLSEMLFIKVPDDFIQGMKIGEEAKIVLIIDERNSVLKLPRNVIRTYMQRKYVQVLVNGLKVEKDVEVGMETLTEAEILSGLNEGDKVILR